MCLNEIPPEVMNLCSPFGEVAKPHSSPSKCPCKRSYSFPPVYSYTSPPIVAKSTFCVPGWKSIEVMPDGY